MEEYLDAVEPHRGVLVALNVGEVAAAGAVEYLVPHLMDVGELHFEVDLYEEEEAGEPKLDENLEPLWEAGAVVRGPLVVVVIERMKLVEEEVEEVEEKVQKEANFAEVAETKLEYSESVEEEVVEVEAEVG